MSKLTNQLSRWQANGLLSPEQSASILSFEENRSGQTRWAAWALAATGIVAVVSGLVSLVAANWEDIPDALKLLVGTLTLSGTALGARRYLQRGNTWTGDILLLLHQGLVLGMIALVAQVYHLSGSPWRPFAVAAAFALVAAAAGTRALLLDVALAFICTALGLFLEQEGEWDRLFRDDLRIALLVGGLSLLSLAGAVTGARLGQGKRTVSFVRWAYALGIGALIFGAIPWSARLHLQGASATWTAVPLGVGAIAFLVSLRRTPTAIEIACLGFGLTLLLGPSVWGLDGLGAKGVGFVLFCGMATTFTFVGAGLGSRVAVNWGSLLLAGRVLALFLELFEDLTQTGVGLISTGLLLLATAYGWWRFRALVPMAPHTTSGGSP